MAAPTCRRPPRGAAALALAAALLALLALPGTATAHGDAHAGRAAPAAPAALDDTQHDWGRAGDPARVDRSVLLDMSDRMRFQPALLRVRLGETLRLRVRNRGALLHELVIGTEAELAAHAELMRRHPGMEHDAPYMAHVAPRRQGELVWQFNRAGRFHFGCLVPGHWEAGMRGVIVVE